VNIIKYEVDKIKIDIHKSTRLLLGEVKCDYCGFTYRLKENELDPLSIPYFSNRIMEKGDLFISKIHELAEQGYSQNAIAKVAKISKPTVSKILNGQYVDVGRSLEIKRKEKTQMYNELPPVK
jgi:DNA-binding XRE family transcriptional regulator